MNDILWHIEVVEKGNALLMDRTGEAKLATTDPSARRIYLSSELRGDLKARVLIHELGHCALFSYNLLYDIHKVVRKEYWLEAEEWLCNYLIDYGMRIYKVAYRLIGTKAIDALPEEFDILLRVS